MGFFSNAFKSVDSSSYGEPAGLTLKKMRQCIIDNSDDEAIVNFICDVRPEFSSLDYDQHVGWSYDGERQLYNLIFVINSDEAHTVGEFLNCLDTLINEYGEYTLFGIEWRLKDGNMPFYETAHPDMYYDDVRNAFVITGSTEVGGIRSTYFAF